MRYLGNQAAARLQNSRNFAHGIHQIHVFQNVDRQHFCESIVGERQPAGVDGSADIYPFQRRQIGIDVPIQDFRAAADLKLSAHRTHNTFRDNAFLGIPCRYSVMYAKWYGVNPVKNGGRCEIRQF